MKVVSVCVACFLMCTHNSLLNTEEPVNEDDKEEEEGEKGEHLDQGEQFLSSSLMSALNFLIDLLGNENEDEDVEMHEGETLIYSS